jgi:hypothetical protein
MILFTGGQKRGRKGRGNGSSSPESKKNKPNESSPNHEDKPESPRERSISQDSGLDEDDRKYLSNEFIRTN